MRRFALLAICLLLAGCHTAERDSLRIADPLPATYPAHWWTPVPKEGAPSWEILPQEAGPGEEEPSSLADALRASLAAAKSGRPATPEAGSSKGRTTKAAPAKASTAKASTAKSGTPKSGSRKPAKAAEEPEPEEAKPARRTRKAS